MLVAIAFAVTAVGPGNWSLDHVLSLDLSGAGWALGALGAGLIGGLGALAQTRLVRSRQQPPHPTAA